MLTRDRKRNLGNFHNYYMDLCKFHNTQPVSSVKSHLCRNALDFYAERLKLEDWRPLLNALAEDRSLHSISFRSKLTQELVLEDADTYNKAKNVVKSPVFISRYVFSSILVSLHSCLSQTKALTNLELEGFPLNKNDLSILLEGVSKCDKLQHLSFHKSLVGDDGCNLICRTLRNSPNIVTIDVSGCGLTHDGAKHLSQLIHYQQIHRFSEGWAHTLRYRKLDTEVMGGLRRVVMNNNLGFSDKGLMNVVEVLRDDVWIKAIDMQGCGLTDKGAEAILELLEINKNLLITDIRSNKNVSFDSVKKVMTKLKDNNPNVDENLEYRWLYIEPQHFSRRSSDTSILSKMSSQGDIINKCSQPTISVQRIPNKPLKIKSRNTISKTLTEQEEYQIQSVAVSSADNQSMLLNKIRSELRELTVKYEKELQDKKRLEKEVHEKRKLEKEVKKLESLANKRLAEFEEEAIEYGLVLVKRDAIVEIIEKYNALVEAVIKKRPTVRSNHASELRLLKCIETENLSSFLKKSLSKPNQNGKKNSKCNGKAISESDQMWNNMVIEKNIGDVKESLSDIKSDNEDWHNKDKIIIDINTTLSQEHDNVEKIKLRSSSDTGSSNSSLNYTSDVESNSGSELEVEDPQDAFETFLK